MTSPTEFVLGAASSDPITVRRLGYGAMRITGPGIWDFPADRDNAIAVVRAAVEAGVNFIDTADSYGPESSEILLREALHPFSDVVIATKAGFTRQGPDQWTVVGHPAYLKQCLEMSLRRLGVETIDLYQLHRIDDTFPLEDQLGVFLEAAEQGKIRHIGVSEVTVEQLRACQEIAPIVSVQNLYNAMNRQHEELVDVCAAEGIGFIPWYPLGGRSVVEVSSALTEIANRRNVTPMAIAIAWLLQRSDVMLPIPGTSSLSHLAENMVAGSIELTESELLEISQISQP